MDTVEDIKKLYPHGMCVDTSFHSDVEKGFTAATKKKLQEAGILITTTEGHDSKGNAAAERTNRKAREYQGSML